MTPRQSALASAPTIYGKNAEMSKETGLFGVFIYRWKTVNGWPHFRIFSVGNRRRFSPTPLMRGPAPRAISAYFYIFQILLLSYQKSSQDNS
jgi:hypothetical protein